MMINNKPNLFYKFPFIHEHLDQINNFWKEKEEHFQKKPNENERESCGRFEESIDEILPEFKDLSLLKILNQNDLSKDYRVFQFIFRDLLLSEFPNIEILKNQFEVVADKTPKRDKKKEKSDIFLSFNQSDMRVKDKNKRNKANDLPEIQKYATIANDPILGEKLFLETLIKLPSIGNHGIEGDANENIKMFLSFAIMINSRKPELIKVQEIFKEIAGYKPIFKKIFTCLNRQHLDESFFFFRGWETAIYGEIYKNLRQLGSVLSLEGYFRVINLLVEAVEQLSELLSKKTFQNHFGMEADKLKQELGLLLRLKDFYVHLKERLSEEEYRKVVEVCMEDEHPISRLLLPFSEQFPEDTQKMSLSDLRRINNFENLDHLKFDSMSFIKVSIFRRGVRQSSQTNLDSTGLSPEIQKHFFKTLDRHKKICTETTLFGRIKEAMKIAPLNKTNEAAEDSLREFTLFVFKSMLIFIKNADDINKNVKDSEEAKAFRRNFNNLLHVSGEPLEVINLVAESCQKKLEGNISIILDLFSTIKEESFMIAFLDKMSQLMEKEHYSNRSVYDNSLNTLRTHLGVKSKEPQKLVLALLREYSKYLNGRETNANRFKIFFFLRTQLSFILQRGINVDNFSYSTLLDELVKDVDNKCYNTCRFFLLAQAESHSKFLKKPKHALFKYLPELKEADTTPPRLLMYSSSLRAKSYAEISKYVEELLYNLLPEDAPKLSIDSPAKFFNLCTIIVNLRFEIVMDKAKAFRFNNFEVKLLAKIDDNFKAIFDNVQINYLKKLINGFQGSRLLCYPKKIIDEIDTQKVALIINITSLCVAFYKTNWIFSTILRNLIANKYAPILFNLKDILIMNDALNQNMMGRRFYKCRACSTPFSIGNCGKADSLGRCVKCKREIGGTSHTPNSNTVEIDIYQFQNRILNDPHYHPNYYNADEHKSYKKLPNLSFRMGHLLTHAIYLGTLELVLDSTRYNLFIPNFQMNFSELKIPNNQLGMFFYRHIDRDMEATRKLCGIQNDLISVLGLCFQELVDVQNQFTSNSIDALEQKFNSITGSFRNNPQNYKKIVEEIDSKEKGFSSQKKLVQKILLIDDVPPKNPLIDYCLYINLRQTKSLDINSFEFEFDLYKKQHPDEDLKFLEFYLKYKVGLLSINKLNNRISLRTTFPKS